MVIFVRARLTWKQIRINADFFFFLNKKHCNDYSSHLMREVIDPNIGLFTIPFL